MYQGSDSAITARVIAGGRTVEVARMKITEAGRRALAEMDGLTLTIRIRSGGNSCLSSKPSQT
jgi:hypothetical protein